MVAGSAAYPCVACSSDAPIMRITAPGEKPGVFVCVSFPHHKTASDSPTLNMHSFNNHSPFLLPMLHNLYYTFHHTYTFTNQEAHSLNARITIHNSYSRRNRTHRYSPSPAEKTRRIFRRVRRRHSSRLRPMAEVHRRN